MSLDLLYFANPMCSWCWGFAPAVQALEGAGHRVTLALGSLGADRARPMREKDKASVREHWEHVARASGQIFDFAFFAREGFVYDTEPACRAVQLVRAHYPALALAAFARLQERFYALGHDITEKALLREAVAEFGIASETFDAGFDASETAAIVAAEWQQTAALGVTGYPTLLAFAGGRPEVVTIGWRPQEEVLATVASLEAAG